jgi:mono/diheme cytochrome c family protein
MKYPLLLSFAALALSGIGCEIEDETSPDQGEVVDAVEAGCDLYADNCAGCHGATARGDGEHAVHLMPGATDLVAPESANKPAEERFQRIMKGGAMPPYNSAMPAFEGQLSDEQVWQILALLDSMANGGSQVCAWSGSGGGGGGASGAGGGTGGGGNMLAHCTEWCGCLATHCASYAGYPFASPGACETTCQQTDPALIACWQDFCAQVPGDPALAGHTCEHAWGTLGAFECE